MGTQAQGREVDLTSFVGRRAALAEGRRLLGGARLVTLVGPGGVGKTRLARRLADEVSRAFPDGTYVVELAELRDPDALATEVATGLGLDDVGRSAADAVATFVRERRVLIVLDSCEHLVAACARLVHGLLHGSSSVRVLATSRQPLGVAGEQLMTVEPLSLPSPGDEHRGGATDSEAVALFVERARLVVPGFELSADNAALLGRLCTVLDGMPLAIELAAARLRILSLAQLADRLRDRFGLLAVAATTGLPRNQTLRASVDWSFDLCSPDEQTLWAWMSVFEGGADLDAVESVCAGAGINAFDAVAGLVDKSVLTPQEVAGRVRYRMLETIRAYGRARLDERGEAEEVTRRHREYFVELARSVGRAWFGPDQRDLMARSAAEHANLRAAFEACLASPAGHQDALVLPTSMWWYWIGHGGIDELLRWLGRALTADQPTTVLTLHAMRTAAFVAAARGDLALVRTYAEQAVALPVDDDSPEVRWDRRWARSFLTTMAGDLAGAIALGRETLRDEITPGPVGAQETVTVLIAMSQRLYWIGRIGEALEQVEEGIRICRRHDDEWSLSFLLSMKGARLADLGRHEDALAAEREALLLARGGFQTWAVVHALEFTAHIFASLDQGTNAAVLFGALSNIWPDIGAVLQRGDEPRHAEWVQHARELVGDEAYAAAYDRGRRMTVDEVVAFVLEEHEPAGPGEAPQQEEATAELTRRELEVAELVARGLSNKEIASALVISPRTAEGHVTRLLDKLGFTTRARVAAWVAERHARQSGRPSP